jgi:pimeloyl-ACP methyl ester carboxylesterase
VLRRSRDNSWVDSMNHNGSMNGNTHYRSAVIDGIDIAYREAGPEDGPVVLLLHGFPTSSRMFRNLMPQLSDRYRVIAPDYPGFGHSGVPDRTKFNYTFDNLADIVDKLLDRLGVGSFTPYVMDFGGPVGFRLALKYPERLSALVMQNAPLYPEAPAGWWGTLGKYWQDGSSEHRNESRSYLTVEAIRDQYLHGVSDPSLVDPDSWIVDHALIQRPGVDEIMLDLLYDIRTNLSNLSEMQELIRSRRPPTLVATGVNDEIFPGEAVRNILNDLPEAEFHALDSGHFALEDKAPEIAVLMRDFLDRTVATSPQP